MTKSSESNQPDTAQQEKRGRRPWRYRNRRNRVPPEPAAPTWVYAGNLAPEVTEDQLQDFFSSTDRELIDVSISKNLRGQIWGKANFANEEQAQSALELNGQKLAGVPVIVEPLKHAPRKAAAAKKTQELNEETNEPDEPVLFVQNVAQDLTEADLENQFKAHGDVASVKIISRTQRSWATVEFETKEDAAAAIAALDGTELSGNPISVRIWRKKPTRARKPSETGTTSDESELNEAVLFVGNLGLDLTEAELTDLFKKHGTIVSVKIAKTRRSAIVEFVSKDDAAAAIDALNGSKLSDLTIGVRFYKKPQRRLERPSERRLEKPSEGRLPQRRLEKPSEEAPPVGPKLYIGNVATTITRDELQTAFADYGEVVKITFPGPKKRPRRYAIIEFATQEQADGALAMNEVELGGKPLQVEALRNPPKKKSPRKQKNAPRNNDAQVSADEPRRQGRARNRVLSATDSFRGNRRKRQTKPKRVVTNPDCHVFVTNVSSSVSKEDLQKYLSSFGQITSFESSRPFKGRKWAAVEMSSAAEAQNLIADTNGVEFRGRTLVARLNSQVTGAAEEPAQADE